MKKIAEMTTDELAVCLCKAAEPISNLMEDEEVTTAFADLAKKMDGKGSVIGMFGAFVSVVVPALLGETHREDTYALLSAVDGKSVAEIKKQNGIKTAKDVWSLFMTDVDMVSMFRPGEEVRAE